MSTIITSQRVLLILSITIVFVVVAMDATPAYVRHFNQMNMFDKMKYLQKKFAMSKRKIAHVIRLSAETEAPEVTTLQPTHRPERQRRRKIYETIMKACGPVVENACSTIHDRCHVSFLSKRSITDDATVGRDKRSAPWYETGRKRAKSMMRLHVSCKLCEKNCWP
ncbi:uncharacterized protein LOC144422019 [Styela clava]